MNNLKIKKLKQQFKYFPKDVAVNFPKQSNLSQEDQHFLIFIPWKEEYLKFVPHEFRSFYKEILPHLSARTTNVHTAICLQYLDEFIEKINQQGKTVNRNIVAYALMLHDSGWSQMTEEEIAASLGVKGLILNEAALVPKEKQAVLHLTNAEIATICKAILYHDKPEKIINLENEMPIEIQLLVDLDHIWSFTHLNFWQDTLRKGISPKKYLKNLSDDLDTYFVTEIGKTKARELLSEREKEINYAHN